MQDLRHRTFEPPLADPRALPSLGLKPGAESQPARQSSGPGSVDEGYRAHAAARSSGASAGSCRGVGRGVRDKEQTVHREERREKERRFGFLFLLLLLKKLDTFSVEGNMAVNILREVSRRRSAQQ